MYGVQVASVDTLCSDIICLVQRQISTNQPHTCSCNAIRSLYVQFCMYIDSLKLFKFLAIQLAIHTVQLYTFCSQDNIFENLNLSCQRYSWISPVVYRILFCNIQISYTQCIYVSIWFKSLLGWDFSAFKPFMQLSDCDSLF